jgi:aminotransferase
MRTPHTRRVLLGYPNNPTGAVLDRGRLLEIAEWAEAHDLLVVSDEIYDRLVYGVEHTCFSSLPNMRERTILLGGFSKSYAMTGWRIGYAAAPPAMLAAMRKIHQYVIMSAPTTGQEAAIEALRSGEEYVEKMREEYDRRRRTIVDGFIAWASTASSRKALSTLFLPSKAAASQMKSSQSACLWKSKWRWSQARRSASRGAGHVRASYATSLPNIEEALNRIESFLNKLK